MFKELFGKIRERSLSMLMSDRFEDRYYGCKIKGEVFWHLTDPATGVDESGKLNNIVTLDASILIARFLRGNGTMTPHQSDPSFGILALAIGTGDVGWNPSFPPAATKTQRSLFNEIARKAVASTAFIAADGSVSGVPTNVVDFTFQFSPGEGTGQIVEMSLQGGDVNPNMAIRNPILPPNGAYDPTVNVVGYDTTCNYVTFPAVNKSMTATVVWTWRLTT